MDNKSTWSSTFELEDIEIINHKKENEEKSKMWNCDQCSLFFLEKEKLDEHKKKHTVQESVKCKYCNKTLEVNSECYVNRKCETCEYKCSKCPQRFLRHSSLINHEKKHVLPKKKRTVSKKVNGICPKNVSISKGLKRNRIEVYDSKELPRTLKTKKISSLRVKNSRQKKQNSQTKTQDCSDSRVNSFIMSPRRLSLKASKSSEGKTFNKNSPGKIKKRLSLKSNKSSEEQSCVGVHTPNNLQAVSPTTNMSTSENVVNYKPFSCHVCGDTFASDSALLDHINTHGENAAKSFKCKFCNDEFGDIYKMQFHLAICPLAEDELEFPLKQAVPVKKPITLSEGTLSPRKRGRPKRLIESTLSDQENTDNESTPSSSKREHLRKRKYEVLENNDEEVHNVTKSPLKKQSNKMQRKDTLIGSGSKRVAVDNDNDNVEVTRELEPDDDRKKLHQCPFPRCDFKFTREKALLCHMRNHSDDFDDSLKCHKCDIPFDDIQTLRQHINTCKGIKEERDDDFHQSYQPQFHDSSPSRSFHKTKKDFACGSCGKSYQSQEKLISHNCQVAASKPLCVTFPCRLCGEPLQNQRMLKAHFQELHPNNLQFQCPTCDQEFDDLDEVTGHMMKHLKYVFDCSICMKRLETKGELNNHYATAHPKRDRSICLVCNKRFADPSGLAKHRHIHTGERPYFCPFCYQTFNLKSSHVNHVRRHINLRPYKCTTCLKSYFNSGDLKKHIRIHTGEKPYRCEICSAKFRLKDVLNAHMKVHANIRPYKCVQCSKAFKTKALLRYHVPIHTGIPSFLCPICPDKYYAMTSLRAHLRKRHVTEDLKCEICGDVLDHRFDLVDHLVAHRSIMIPISEPIVPYVQTKGRRPKKALNSQPIKGHKVKSAPSTVSKKGGKRNIRKSRKKQVYNKANKKDDQTVINDCADSQNKKDGQTKEGTDGQVNGEEKCEDYEIIEIKEEIPYMEEDDVQLLQTNVIDQCLMCSKIFESREDLANHIYVHI